MLKEGESVLGLDITRKGIKVVELKKTSQGMALVRLNTISLLSESKDEEGFIIEPKAVSLVLAEFIQSQGISANKVVFVANLPQVVTRLIRLPFISKDEIEFALENEVNQYADFRDKERFIDFCLTEEISEEGIKKVNVLFSVIFKKIVDYFMEVAKLANLEPIAIEAGNLSIVRALDGVNFKSTYVEPVMLIVINSSDIQLSVVKGNRLRFLHVIKINIRELPANKEDFINRLIIAIKLALNYYERSGYGGETVLKIIVNPNEALAKELDKELADRLSGLSIEKANPLGRLYIDRNSFPEDLLENIRLTYGQIIGAALKTEDPINYPLSINLIPHEKQKLAVVNKELPLYVSCLSIVLTASLVVWSVFSLDLWFIQRKIIRLSMQLEKVDVSLAKVVGGWSSKDIWEEKIREGSFLISQAERLRSILWSGLFAEAMVVVPDELWLSDLTSNIKEESITVEGNSLLEKSIFDYVNALNNNRYFSKVELLSSQTQGNSLHFIIKCQVRK
jgi:hypothetical protein